jgi:hypothetical protein
MEIIVQFCDKYKHTETRTMKFRPNVGDVIQWRFEPAPRVKECVVMNDQVVDMFCTLD